MQWLGLQRVDVIIVSPEPGPMRAALPLDVETDKAIRSLPAIECTSVGKVLPGLAQAPSAPIAHPAPRLTASPGLRRACRRRARDA